MDSTTAFVLPCKNNFAEQPAIAFKSDINVPTNYVLQYTTCMAWQAHDDPCFYLRTEQPAASNSWRSGGLELLFTSSAVHPPESVFTFWEAAVAQVCGYSYPDCTDLLTRLPGDARRHVSGGVSACNSNLMFFDCVTQAGTACK